MSKKYNFNKKQLIKDFFNLKNKLITKDLTKDEIIINEYYLDAILCILKSNRINFNNYPYLFMSKKDIKTNIMKIINNFSTKYQNDIIKNSYDEVIFENNFDYNFSDKKIPLEEQFNLINKNFSKVKELEKAHNKIFNPNNNLLKINKIIDKNYFFNTYNNSYILNKNNNSIEDYLALCHEIGHFDECFFTDDRLWKNMVLNDNFKTNNYEEVYSLFYELVSLYNLYKNNYITENEALYYFDDIRKTNTKNIEYYIISNETKKNENLKYIRKLNFNIEDISMYYYSYLIAISLFEKYLEDEEKAFYNLNYLVSNITPNNETKVLNYCDIDLYNSREIKKHIEKIKRNSLK